MQFITALRDACFANPVYGPGVLRQGQTYYTFGQFAREAAGQGLVRILDQAPLHIIRFLPLHLHAPDQPRRILLMFSGGLGDAVSVGIVLPLAMEQYHFEIDICCDKNKWEAVFHPMAWQGRYIPFPPDLDTLTYYEAVLCDITDFFDTRQGLKTSPVIQLLQGFHLPKQSIKARYRIPPAIRERMLLPPTSSNRLGLNLDSNGLVKSYPPLLYWELFDALRSKEFEIHLLGNKGPAVTNRNLDGLYDWRDKTSIPELAALILQMDLVLGVDSFIAHLANLLAVRSLVILSTTAPSYFECHRHITCLTSDLDCSPCFAVFDQCPKGYSGCRAFEHDSMNPAVIARKLCESLIPNA